MALTGLFPKDRDQPIERGVLQLVKCMGSNNCGLVQLTCSHEPSKMYGDDYGYRSSLNASMTRHLRHKIKRICKTAPLREDDLIVDIGSNDGTSLAAYPTDKYRLIGIDPTGSKFHQYYPPHIELITDFFSLNTLRKQIGPKQARVITSFSMFYDLEAPLEFMSEVLDLLEEDGIWIFEQSYLLSMIEANSYDTACHEHLEYYSLSTIKWMADKAGGKILDVEFNSINGGSFSVTMARKAAPQPEMKELGSLLAREQRGGFSELGPYNAFAERVSRSRDILVNFLNDARRAGKRICGLGASTKGNVLLQYCGLTESHIACIGEVNPDKFGSLTPGSLIPIVPEAELFAYKPDYTLVLPWHFRPFFEQNAKLRELNLVFPLPELSVH